VGTDIGPRGPASGLLLREDEPAIAGDLEHAAAAADEFDRRLRELPANIGLQPGGVGEIVSDAAVLDRDMHGGQGSGGGGVASTAEGKG
jgi:hypothetical protein